MEQNRTQNIYTVRSRLRAPHTAEWRVFWSISWMIMALPWLLAEWLMSAFPWIQAFWWPFIFLIILVSMFVGAFFVYVIFPRAIQQRRTSQSVSSRSPVPPSSYPVYERGYQEQRAGEIWETLDDSSQIQAKSTWDNEQPWASYPEQKLPGIE